MINVIIIFNYLTNILYYLTNIVLLKDYILPKKCSPLQEALREFLRFSKLSCDYPLFSENFQEFLRNYESLGISISVVFYGGLLYDIQ